MKILVAVCALAGLSCELDASLKHRCETSSDCLSGRVCVRNVCQTPASPDAPNYMFVTSQMYPTRFKPIEQADDKCNQAATDAGLPGDYRAWLSNAVTYARDRLAGARGWVRPDGAPFADRIDDIIKGRIITPPLLDEFGAEVIAEGFLNTEMLIATGTNALGLNDPGATCHEWANDEMGNVTVGVTTATGWDWSTGTNAVCGNPMRIYCFGVDRNVALPPRPVSGRRAFLSEKGFLPGAGPAAADAVCAADAAAAGLAGTFLALLATTESSAASRFSDLPDAIWERADGIAINASGSEPFGPNWLLAPLNVTSRGEYVVNDIAVAGAQTPTGLADEYHCDNWTTSVGEVRSGNVTRRDSWFGAGGGSCAVRNRVYCLEH